MAEQDKNRLLPGEEDGQIYEDLPEDDDLQEEQQVEEAVFARPPAPKNQGKKPEVQTGFILLSSPQLNWEAFKQTFEADWALVPQGQEKRDSAVLTIDGVMVAVSLMPMRVPGEEAEANARNNFFWPEAETAAKEHTAHILLAAMGASNAKQQAGAFVKIAASLLKQPNALGIYCAPTVLEPSFYIEQAQTLKEEALPAALLVYVGLYSGKDGIGGYTLGMRTYGKDEMEVIDSSESAEEVYNFLYSIADYILNSDVTLQDGETIGFTETQKCAIARSNGVAVEGESLKITF